MFVTGMSSANARRLLQRQTIKSKETHSKASLLKPHAQMILDWIEKEKSNVVNIEKIVLDVTNKDNLHAQIIAIGMHLEFLNNLTIRAKNLLRIEANARKDEAENE